MAVEIISTAGQAHLVRAFYSAFYRDVIWIIFCNLAGDVAVREKKNPLKEEYFYPLKVLKLKDIRLSCPGDIS